MALCSRGSHDSLHSEKSCMIDNIRASILYDQRSFPSLPSRCAVRGVYSNRFHALRSGLLHVLPRSVLYVIEREATSARVSFMGFLGCSRDAGTSRTGFSMPWWFTTANRPVTPSFSFSFLAAFYRWLPLRFIQFWYRLFVRRRYWFYCAVFPSLWVVSEIIPNILPNLPFMGARGLVGGNILSPDRRYCGIYASRSQRFSSCSFFMFLTGIKSCGMQTRPGDGGRFIPRKPPSHPIAISGLTVAVILLYGSFRLYGSTFRSHPARGNDDWRRRGAGEP